MKLPKVVKERICLKCKYKGRVPKSTHTSCLHPLIEEIGVKKAALELRIDVLFFAVMKGWFTWPFDFDSIWLENCGGFEENDNKDK